MQWPSVCVTSLLLTLTSTLTSTEGCQVKSSHAVWTEDMSFHDTQRLDPPLKNVTSGQVSHKTCAEECMDTGSCRAFAVEAGNVCFLYDFGTHPHTAAMFYVGMRNFNMIDPRRGCPEDHVFMESPPFCAKLYNNESLAWDDARAFCQSRGQDLPVLDSPAKMAAVENVVDVTAITHIGLHYLNPGPTGGRGWFWVNGSAYDFSYGTWKSGEPNNIGTENCAMFIKGTSPTLGNYYCYDHRYPMFFFCQGPLENRVPLP